jgi:hypothetical protein
MPRFLLALRDERWSPETLSPEEIQSILGRYRAWITRIGGAGQKLRDNEGRVLRKDAKVEVTDGPYAEAKEVLGGFLVVEAGDYDEVVRNCQDSPHLDIGSIEIRQIED